MASNTPSGQSPTPSTAIEPDEPAGGTIDVRQESARNETVSIDPNRAAGQPPQDRPSAAEDHGTGTLDVATNQPVAAEAGGTVDLARGAVEPARIATLPVEEEGGTGTVDLSGNRPAEHEEGTGTVDLSRGSEEVARTQPPAALAKLEESGGTIDSSSSRNVAASEPATGTIDSVATGATQFEHDSPTKFDQSKQSASGASVAQSQAPAASQDRGAPPAAKQFEQRRPLRPESTGRDTRHNITRFLAEGGLGKVFVAQDIDLNREVVLKTLKPETAKNADAKKRFVKESQVNAQLEHPNIIPIYQAGKNPDDGQPFYTMKFIRGKELADLIAKYHEQRRAGKADPLAFRTLLGLFVNACYALSYAHHRGVVHRDLKPGNIAVGEFGELIVLDWGLAKVLGEVETVDEEEPAADAAKSEPANSPRRVSVTAEADTGLTMKGRIMGTPGYMAPEQAAGKIGEIGPPADIYGLGGILFEILTGEPPHKLIHKYEQDKIERWSRRDSVHASKLTSASVSTTGSQLKENTMDMLGRIVSGTVPSPRDIEPAAPLALEAIVKKSMKLDAKERYTDAKEIAEDVARWLGDEPVSVHQDTWQERIGRWMRKNRLKVQVGFLAAIAIITVSIVASVLINGARKSEKQQKENVAELLRQARKQIDGLMNDVIGVRENFPNFDDQSAELLLGRISEYEKLRDQIKDQLLPQGDSPLLRAELGRLNLQLAFVQKRFSNLKAAQKSYEDAESIWTELVRRRPAEVNYKVNLAATLDNLADVRLDTGLAADEALKLYDRAIQILQEVNQGGASDLLDARTTRAKIVFHKANSLKTLERFDEADTLYREAIQAFQGLSKDAPDNADNLILAAEAANRLVVLLTDRGRYAEALRFDGDTLAGLEKAVAERAEASKARGLLAGNAVDRARPMEQLGLDRAASDSYDVAAENYKLLLETPQYANSPKFLFNLATSLYNSGLLLGKMGDAPSARQNFKAAELTAGRAYDFYANPAYLRRHIASLNAGARVTADLGKLDDAQTLYEGALANTTALIAELEKNGLDTREDRRQLAVSRGGLARVLGRLGQPAEAVLAATEAINEWEKLMQETAEPTPFYLLSLAGFHVTRGDLLFVQQDAAAAANFDMAKSLFGQAVEKSAGAPEILNTFANFLLTCSDDKHRDHERAREFATTASNAAPQNGRYKTTLALAHYRAGRWDESLAAADEAIRLRQPIESPLDHFIRAMALAKKGDAAAAAERLALARANELMAALGPANIDYVRLSKEAQELLAPPADRCEPKPQEN